MSLVISNIKKYNAIVEMEKTSTTMWSIYFIPCEFYVDLIAEDFKSNYDGRHFMATVYKILFYELFGNMNITFFQYEQLVIQYSKESNSSVDDLYEYSIKFLTKLIN